MNLFVTGTDTGCGKTFVTAALLRHLARRGTRALGMKPIASGAERTADGLVNEDVAALVAAANVAAPPAIVNPYLFEPPASPHIAAAASGAVVDLAVIAEAYAACRAAAEVVLVEGVGGWQVPLAEDVDLADLVRALGLPVLLVVGIRLGCINHALLSIAAIAEAGVVCHGWVANVLEPDLYAREAVVETLARRIPAPLLATIENGDTGSLDALAASLADTP
ncbi:MAG: dethiobiotin synthase [Gammaproteobacteria bacterium]|nr:dethiobiotin synthase [Gammaproteobacteria bacterium]MCP5200548.1 dethiobiotin synthase [Gammaproteobacteria bacterium]